MTHFRELTDRYTLEKILRSTREGTVLRGIDNRTGQPVAVKLITVASPPLLVQKGPELEKLGTALESLREPSLPVVSDSGFTTEGSAFLIMELIEGKPLGSLAASPQRLLGLLAQALDGLEALARRGMAHHNLNPDNLLVTGAPPAERVKVLGLGSAVFRGAGPAPAETARFRAPEMSDAAGNAPADWRADLFSFALTACQVLGINLAAGDPPSLQMPFALSLDLANADALRQILERCLRTNPAERPSHQEIRDGFRLALGGDGLQPAPSPEPKPAAPKLVLPTPLAPPTPPLRVVPPPAPPMPQMPPTPEIPAGTGGVGGGDDFDGEMLSAIDDDVLDALAGAPLASRAPSSSPTSTEARVVPFRAAGSAAAAVPPPKPNPLLRPEVLIGVAAVLIALAAGAFWWLGRGSSPLEEQGVASSIPAPPPRRPATVALAEAQQSMADEEWASALATLRTLNGADQATLTPAGCRTLTALEETLALVAVERLPEDLSQGLKRGDLGRLRFAVSAAESQEAVLPENLQTDLLRARAALDLYAGVEEAAARKAPAEVLERFALLEKDLPGVSDPLGFREQAAASLEEEAEALARAGSYEEAQARLDTVLRGWPKREPARGRSEVYRRARQRTSEQEALLAALPTAEKRRRPHEGLEMLKGVEPVPHLAAQIDDFRQRLTDQLAALDQKPPQVLLRDGFFLDYNRGTVVELSFRVTDDYMVRKVKLMARPEGGKMRELPLEKSAIGYDVEIPADFHRNGTVELYVVATDASGHEGFFGTPGEPKVMKRRQGFERIVN